MRNKIHYYLGIANAVAQRSTCLRRQHGAVIVNNDEIIATGYNGAPRGTAHCAKCGRLNSEHGEGYEGCRSVHAEMNAIISAARSEMIGSTMYLACIKNGEELTDIAPCDICMRLIKNAGIKEVITRERLIIV